MYNDEQKNKIVEEFKQLLLINSKTANISGVKKMGEAVLELIKDLPVTWEKISKENSADFLIGRTSDNDPNKPILLMSAHIDTVYPAEELEVKEIEDKIYGAGAQDVKGSVIVIIELLRRLNKEGKLKNIIVAFSPEEELATPNFREEIKSLASKVTHIMVFEPTLNSLPDADLSKRSIVRSRRGFQGFEIIVKSAGGHSGVLFKKEQRKNCILKMAEIIIGLEEIADYNKVTTLNSGVIEGGKAYNIIAPECRVICDVRFKLNDERERVINDINELIKYVNPNNEFKIEFIEDIFFPAMNKSPISNEFAKLCMDVAHEFNIELLEEDRGGGSESSLYQFFNPLAAVLDGFGIRGDGEHTTHEFVYKESIFTSIEYSLEVIKRLL